MSAPRLDAPALDAGARPGAELDDMDQQIRRLLATGMLPAQVAVTLDVDESDVFRVLGSSLRTSGSASIEAVTQSGKSAAVTRERS